ncbi:MAG: hypothetical protein ABI045_01215 [Flavobacteriales bacterium]
MTIKGHTRLFSFKTKNPMKNDKLSFKLEKPRIYRHNFKVDYEEKPQSNTLIEDEI